MCRWVRTDASENVVQSAVALGAEKHGSQEGCPSCDRWLDAWPWRVALVQGSSGEHGHRVERQLIPELRPVAHRPVEGHRANTHHKRHAQHQLVPHREVQLGMSGPCVDGAACVHGRREHVERLADIFRVNIVVLAPVEIRVHRAPRGRRSAGNLGLF